MPSCRNAPVFGPSGARTDASLDLTAEGRSPHSLVSTLAGAARLDFSGGRLNGIDPAAVQEALDEAPTSAEVLRRLRRALVSGGSPLASDALRPAYRAASPNRLPGALRLQADRSRSPDRPIFNAA